MFFNRIRKRESGILLYGITPPKSSASAEKVKEAGEKVISTLCSQDLDALVVYDVQDETARTNEERPFPFSSSLDPFEFSCQYLEELAIPKIIYRPAGNFTKEALTQWLDGLHARGFFPIFVGLPSPDYVVKTSLQEAYAIWRERCGETSLIGAVTIPERHAILKDEETRILDKVSSGVSFFISQCIFNVEYTQKMLEDLVKACAERKQPVPTVIFTLTICGSPKTLEFMEWLGIHVPSDIKEELRTSTNAVGRSVEIATAIAANLIRFCLERSIPFGFNIESVATRKTEIEASLELLNTVSTLLKSHGLRSESVVSDVLKNISASVPDTR